MRLQIDIHNFEAQLKNLSLDEQVTDKVTERIEQGQQQIQQYIVDTVVERATKGIGENRIPWRPHGAKTMMTRIVKKEALGYNNVLPPSPTAFLRPEMIEDLKSKTLFKIFPEKKQGGLTFQATFKSGVLDMDVSHPRTGIRTNALRFANDKSYQLGGEMVYARRARALVIPLLPTEAELLLEFAYQRYMMQHRTRKTQIASGPNETGPNIFSWRDAGLRQEGNAIWAFRPKTLAGIAQGGQRPFLYPFDEIDLNGLRAVIQKLFS